MTAEYVSTWSRLRRKVHLLVSICAGTFIFWGSVVLGALFILVALLTSHEKSDSAVNSMVGAIDMVVTALHFDSAEMTQNEVSERVRGWQSLHIERVRAARRRDLVARLTLFRSLSRLTTA